MIAASSVTDPRQLSSQQRRALALIKAHRLYRRQGGYGRAPLGVSLDIVASLRGLGLVRIDHPTLCPTLTGSGLMVVSVIEQRQERRRA